MHNICTSYEAYAVYCNYTQTWNNGGSRPAVWYYHAGKRSIYTGICQICWKMNWRSRRSSKWEKKRKDFLNDWYPGLAKTRDNIVSGMDSIFMDFPGLMMIFMKNWKKF